MKRFTPDQIQNMVYIVAIVIACTVIGVYFGKGWNTQTPTAADATPVAAETPAGTPEPGVQADDVRLAFLSYGYAIDETNARNTDWVIEDVPSLGSVSLSCAKQAKRVLSLSIHMEAPHLTTPKPGSLIESALDSSAITGVPAAYRDALACLLEASAYAMSDGKAFAAADLSTWVDGAISTLSTGTTWRMENERAVFTCVRQSGVQFDTLICTLTCKDG